MNVLRRLLLWFGITVLAVSGLFLINVGAHRLLGADDAQRAALATLDAARATPQQGRNAFGLLWLMAYDVPDADIERIAADDVRQAHARFAAGRGFGDLVPPDRPRLHDPGHSEPGLCTTRERGCLVLVRTHGEATRALVATHARWIERMRMLEERDFYRYEFPLRFDMPLPLFGSAQRLQLSALALAWSDGHRAEALAGVCRNVSTWRRLRHGTQSLIFSMMAVSFLTDATDLYADMLAELPDDEPVPAECATAFAPIARADVDFCSEAAGEHAVVEATLDNLLAQDDELNDRGAAGRALRALVVDRAQVLATRAQNLAGYCTDEQRVLALADKMTAPPVTQPGMLACAANVMGCAGGWSAAPGLDPYRTRLLDSAARLRLAATLLWQRDTRDDPRTLAERFATRPDALRSGSRASGISEDGRSIWVDNLDQSRGARFTLALGSEKRSTP